jgi:mannose-1-phosphate guanylyltransferase
MGAGKGTIGNEGQMKAMVLAAGLGTRLRPLTDDRPKALVEIDGRSLLEITLTRLKQFGVHDAIVNVHHFAEMVVNHLKAHHNFGMHIEVSREEVLLDTGGGLKKAAWFFLEDPAGLDQPFLLHNVDVISAIDFRQMLDFHTAHNALATLAVQDRETSRYLLFNDDAQLCGRRLGKDGKQEIVCAAANLQALAFSGIHVISPRLLRMMKDGIFSIIDTYLHLAASSERILSFNAERYYWRDLGKPNDLKQAAEDFRQKIVS